MSFVAIMMFMKDDEVVDIADDDVNISTVAAVSAACAAFTQWYEIVSIN